MKRTPDLAVYQSGIRPDHRPLFELLPLERPLSLYIDPSSVCNFRCAFCYQSHIDYSGYMMTRELFDRIADSIAAWGGPVKMAHVAGYGEPLLNKDLPYFIHTLKSRGLAEYTKIVSNCSLLDADTASSLVDAGLDILHISLYGMSDEQYRKFTGRSVSFERIYGNMKTMYEITDGGKRCGMHIKIAGDYFTDDERKKFLEMFAPITTSIHIDRAVNAWPGIKTVEDADDGTSMYGVDHPEPPICAMPFYQMVIHSNGLVSPCCPDFDRKMIVGDVTQSSLMDIWNGERYKRLRMDILRGSAEHHLCRLCSAPQSTGTAYLNPYRKQLLEMYGS